MPRIETQKLISFTPEDLDSFWELLPRTILVSYQEYVTATDSYGTTHSNIQSLDNMIDKREVEQGDGNFVFKRFRTFTLRASTLPDVQVTKRGKVTDNNGVVWVVVSAFLKAWGTHWQIESYALNG